MGKTEKRVGLKVQLKTCWVWNVHGMWGWVGDQAVRNLGLSEAQ